LSQEAAVSTPASKILKAFSVQPLCSLCLCGYSYSEPQSTEKKRVTRVIQLKPDFDATIDHTPFSVRVNLGKGGRLMWRENHLGKSALPSVGDVFEINKEAVLAERLLA